MIVDRYRCRQSVPQIRIRLSHDDRFEELLITIQLSQIHRHPEGSRSAADEHAGVAERDSRVMS